MCGIFGAIAANKRVGLLLPSEKFIRQSIIAGTLRGLDGTGLVTVTDKDATYWRKSAQTGPEFVKEMGNISSLKSGLEGDPYIMYGHNRAATVGTVSDDTAHPFEAPNVVGIHNGTLSYGWKRRLNAKKSIEVDSEALMRCISHRGPMYALPKAEGAMAIVWTNTKTNQTYMFRNSERPVSYCHSVSGNLYWASEAGMLEWLLDRGDIAIDKDGIKDLPIDTIFNITTGQLVSEGTVTGTGTPRTNHSTTYANYSGTYGSSGHYVKKEEPLTDTPATSGSPTDSGNVIDFPADSCGDPKVITYDDLESPKVMGDWLEDGEVLLHDGYYVSNQHDAHLQTKVVKCACCNVEIDVMCEDHIRIEALGTYGSQSIVCDNNFCLPNAFRPSGGSYIPDLWAPVTFVMHRPVDFWGEAPMTTDKLHFLMGNSNYEYICDSIQARIAVDPTTQTTHKYQSTQLTC